jgi:hypothetical protein
VQRIARAITRLYMHEHAAALGVPVDDFGAFRKAAARRSVPGVRADPYFSALAPTAEALASRTEPLSLRETGLDRCLVP